MDIKKLDGWANLLLDTGKRNNLVNFKDTKSSTVEVVLPDISSLFEKADTSATFEVFDPKFADKYDDADDEESEQISVDREDLEGSAKRAEYIRTYSPKIKKANQILLYSSSNKPLVALKSIHKKARTAIEETGVNVAHIAFGFINWKEDDGSDLVYRAPILLAPVLFENESAVEPYYIKTTEDDIIVNPTFSHRLKLEYGITIPEYEDEGFDQYLEKVSDIVSKLGWTCSKACKIGIFSFLKINMYNDLKENAETIMRNENVKKLLGEPVDIELKTAEPDSVPGDASQKNLLVELHNVVDADSSQLEAIEMAKSGKSFVLQGPPGTGKSQTITNIIAECLNDGKKVLFVSEKLAALNVVFEKLKWAGLSEFCLELHSHKANKKDVIEELCRTLKAAKSTVSSSAKAEIYEKIKAQKQLDEYAEELHRVRLPINKTLYQLYSAYTPYEAAADIDYFIDEIESKGDEYINEVKHLLDQYVKYIPSIGYDYRSNPWFGCCVQNASYQAKTVLKSNFEKSVDRLNTLEDVSAELSKSFGVSAASVNELDFYKDFLSFLGSSAYVTPALLSYSVCSYAKSKIARLVTLSKTVIDLRNLLLTDYDKGLLELNGGNLHKRLAIQFSSPFSRLFNKEYKEIILELKLCRKDAKKPKYDEALITLKKLANYQEKLKEFSELEADIKANFGNAYLGVDSNWETLISQLEYLEACLVQSYDFEALSKHLASDFANKQNELLSISNRLMSAPDENALTAVTKAFRKDDFDALSLPLSAVKDKCLGCLNNFDMLDNWCKFDALFATIKDIGIDDFIDLAIENNIAGDKLIDTFCKAFYRGHIDRIVYGSDVLSSFARISQDEAIKIFSEKDEFQFGISKAQIKAKLSAKRPSLDLIASGSAVSVLMREGSKKRKQKSIRTLFSEIGELAQVLKPCFLMSPLSISTFLSASGIRFDVVIFDEASQIFPQDAVGAIYRGSQLIVVGDSKQMPPSNFFNTTMDVSEDDNSETDDVTDFESILDMCSTTLPQIRLKWHYRSRFEPLISFSNKNFYDNDLVTFPSSKLDEKWIGVDYHYVDGTFDHTSKANLREAEYIVDLIYENFEKFPERSLGVVAFSISQQALIERLLHKRRLQNLSKESFFRSDKKEPFFIKNLETVQGDERDTIIFSVGYGKDSRGIVSHNFGPLNRAGGERRLNVAVTRAKINVQLVSSMHHTDINLNQTSAEGVRLLKEYLDYAENGIVALERNISVDPYEDPDSNFEKEVCEFLKANGFSVDAQVGCSSFRIDLAVKSPSTSNYVLAIECDGASYHSSRNARDRDRLRQSVLEKMGWKFYRIWSTDWFKNNRVEKEKLLLAVKEALENQNVNFESSSQSDPLPDFEELTQNEHFEFPKYERADLYNIKRCYGHNFQLMVKEILKKEAPLSEDWLLKNIVDMFCREKVTSVVEHEYGMLMLGCEENGIIRKNGFLYLAEQTDFVLRIPSTKNWGSYREIKHIALEELAAGMYEIIKQNVSVEKDGLYLTIVKLLGVARAGSAIHERLDEALALLQNEVNIEGNTITVK